MRNWFKDSYHGPNSCWCKHQVKILRDAEKPFAEYINVINMVCEWKDKDGYVYELPTEFEYEREEDSSTGALMFEDISPIDEIDEITKRIERQVGDEACRNCYVNDEL